MSRWPDGQNPWSSLDLDFVSQPRNLKQRLGEAYPSRVADFDQPRSNHDHNRQTCSHCSHVGNDRASPALANNAIHQARHHEVLVSSLPLGGLVMAAFCGTEACGAWCVALAEASEV